MPKLASKTTTKATTGRRKTRPPRSVSYSYLDSLGGVSAGVAVNKETALTWSAFYCAVNIIAEAVASLPLKVYKRVEKFGREAKVHAFDHPVDRLVRIAPNDEQTPTRWKEYSAGSMCIMGNGYSEIVRDRSDTPLALMPLHPERVEVKRDEETREIYYNYSSDGRPPLRLSPKDVLHFPLFGDDIVGKSPVTVFRETIGLGISSERFASAFLGNGSAPSGALVHPEHLEDAGRNQLIAQLEKRHRGPQNAGRVLVLEDGMTWHKIGVDAKDAQFLEQRTFQVLEVARIFRIPAHMLAENSKATFSNIEHQSIEFLKNTLMPYLIRIEEEINRKLLPPTGEFYAKFNVDALLRADIKTRNEAFAIGRQWGWWSANDVREKMDEDPLPPDVGDIYLSPVNMIPAEKAGDVADSTAQTPKTGQKAQKEGEKGPEKAEKASADKAIRRLFRDATGRLLAKETACLDRILKKNKPPPDTDADIRAFYKDFEADVVATLGPSWEAHAEIVGKTADLAVAASRYVSQQRQAVLEVFRSGERPELDRLLTVWRQCRAEIVAQEYMEAYNASAN